MLIDIGTTAEEWFRIEILSVLLKLPGVTVVGTNHCTQQGADRPDFTLTWNNHELLVELKVLPQDKNYRNGWQRFLASPNNRKDFNSIVAGTRSGVIYIHWADEGDWGRADQRLKRGLKSSAFKKTCSPALPVRLSFPTGLQKPVPAPRNLSLNQTRNGFIRRSV